MKTLLKILAIALIIFGSIMSLAGIGVMLEDGEDIVTWIIALVIIGVQPIVIGVLILQKISDKTPIKTETPVVTDPIVT